MSKKSKKRKKTLIIKLLVIIILGISAIFILKEGNENSITKVTYINNRK